MTQGTPEALQRISEALQASPVFSSLGRLGLARLARRCSLQRLPGGEILYEEGGEADALYLIAHGRLRAERMLETGLQVLRQIRPGETVGGLSLMAGKPHRATLRAVRDSEIVRIPEAAVDRLLYRHPRFGRDAVSQWLRTVLYTPPPKAGDERRSARTVAVVPAHEGAPVEVVADALLKAMARRGDVVRVDGDCIDGPGRERHCEAADRLQGDPRLLESLERQHQFVVYMAREAQAGDGAQDDWCARCLRQADRIVVVTSSGVAAHRSPMADRLRSIQGKPEPEVVVVGDGPSDMLAWRDIFGARMHHRVRVGETEGFDRMVRMLTGQAIGLALGGGGARGFAHIGLLQAMEGYGLKPDLIVGTSMGALIGALAATRRNVSDVREQMHDMFVARNLLNDFTVPRVSLIRARRARQHLEKVFGETRIEAMRGYFACTTTNLTRGRAELHDRGLLWHWLAASMSVPGVAPPVIYNGDVLVDGGVLTPVPSNALAELDRGPVIASDVSAEEIFASGERLSARADGDNEGLNIFRILYRTATLSTQDDVFARAARTDCYLTMPVSGVGIFDWDAFDDIIARGRQHAEERLGTWMAERERAEQVADGHPDGESVAPAVDVEPSGAATSD